MAALFKWPAQWRIIRHIADIYRKQAALCVIFEVHVLPVAAGAQWKGPSWLSVRTPGGPSICLWWETCPDTTELQT